MNCREIKSASWMLHFGLLSFSLGICTVVLRIVDHEMMNEFGKNFTVGVGALLIIVGSALIATGVQNMIIAAHEPESETDPQKSAAQTATGR